MQSEMENDDDEWAKVLFYSVATAVVISSMLTFSCTGYSLNNKWREQAVKAGVAEYVADKDGKAQWKWKVSNER